MRAYEYYLDDGCGETVLFGILPERRTNPRRITPESIIGWGQLIAGNHVDAKRIHITRIELEKQLFFK